MKWLKEENGQLLEPPSFDKETGMVNCHLNEQWLLKHGYKQWTNMEESSWYEINYPGMNHPNTADFDNACAYFKQVCQEIGELINEPDFKGGYDDMVTFYSHPAYKTDTGMQLAIAWSGCNDLCRYEANKIGLGSPEWWYKCWEKKEN